MTLLEGWRDHLPEQDQVMQWGSLALSLLLLMGLLFAANWLLLPQIQRRSNAIAFVATAQTELVNAEQAKRLNPARLQQEVAQTEQRLAAVSSKFMGEAAATAAVNRLYAHAQATGTQIVNVTTATPAATDYYAQRDFQFQLTGSLPDLLAFLGRIEESEQPGFVMRDVQLVPEEAQHRLTLQLSVYTSPYATPVQEAQLADLQVIPLAQVQQQLEDAWHKRDWQQALALLEPVVAADPDNQAARLALYRAHVNYGYQLLAARDATGAQAQFEAALALNPNGTEAQAELQLAARAATLVNATNDQLRQAVEQAQAAQNWPEVIRTLRLLGAVDSGYTDGDDQLFDAYLRYADQLMAQGQTSQAEEQYQLAQSLRPDATIERVPPAPAPVSGLVPAPSGAQ